MKGRVGLPFLSLLSNMGVVMKDKLQDVVRGDKCQVNNKQDDKYLAWLLGFELTLKSMLRVKDHL